MIRSSSGTSFDGEATYHLRLLGTVLSAAVLLGIGGQSLEVARDYALTREQFNAPIASFQALKHLMADMFVRVELARSATYAPPLSSTTPEWVTPSARGGSPRCWSARLRSPTPVRPCRSWEGWD